jgi:D-arabinose 1-dehydrogenase-like Zn-dependent alcohol dehydrogenase
MKAVIINDKIEIKDIELNNLYDNEARVELLYSGLC